jgi:hypothetical protein
MSGRRQFKLIAEDQQYGGRTEELFTAASLDDIREFIDEKDGLRADGGER